MIVECIKEYSYEHIGDTVRIRVNLNIGDIVEVFQKWGNS